MLSAFTNSFKIPELRQKIFLTLSLLFIARVGAVIPLPGIDSIALQEYYNSMQDAGGGLMGLYNMFTGGALMKGAVFALGIMPYISASIIMQLMGAVWPALSRLQQQGEIGRQKITQYTRYGTIIIAVVQSFLLLTALVNSPGSLFPGFQGSAVINPGLAFMITSVVLMTTGCVILMWLGEQITQKGIGNGISLLITVGILSDLPAAVGATYQLFFNRSVGVENSMAYGIPQFALLIALFFIVTGAIVALTQAIRKIPVQYARRVVGSRLMGGQSSYLPLKVNYTGVMPIIFASAILLFPQQIFGTLGVALNVKFLEQWGQALLPGNALYYILYIFLIMTFSYFWVSIMFKPIQIADDLKKNSGYIPGIRPGEPTARFLDFTMTRLTFAGAVFLTIIAVFPDFLTQTIGIPSQISRFFGGTGILICVGVVLDTLRQIETYLLQRHYDGFLKKGRIRGRSNAGTQILDTKQLNNLWALWTPLIIIFFVGIAAYFLRKGI